MARITGQAVYTADILPDHLGVTDMVYMGLVRCPYPRANVKSIDVSKAVAAGYVTLEPSEIPPYGMYGIGRPYSPLPIDGVTMYPGQPVVAVGAPSPNEVRDALDLVSVTYEPLPYVFDAEEALQPGAPQLYEGGNSPATSVVFHYTPVTSTQHIEFGDAATAIAQADVKVSLTAETGVIQHFEMEPVSAVAWWTEGGLFLYGKDTWVHSTQASFANYFGLPLADVTVRTSLGGTETGMTTGGVFGNAVSADQYVLTSLMSKKAGAPVKYTATRSDNSLTTTARYPVRGYVTLGAMNDGTITGMQVRLYENAGARGGYVGDVTDDFYDSYNIANVTIDCYTANTDAYNNGAYQRDVGESQAHFILESAVDMLAQKLNVDPVQFRLQNMRGVSSTGAPPVDAVSGLTYTGYGNPAAMNQGATAFGWTSSWKGWDTASAVNGSIRTGVGLSSVSSNKGAAFPPTSSQIQVGPDGTVTVYTGHTDHGAGTSTTLPIMAAEALGLTSLENVVLVASDTSLTTDSSVTAGSQSTRNAGPALIAAAQDLGTQWFPIVAAKLAPGTKASNLAFQNDTIYDTTNPSNSMSFKDAAALLTAPITGQGTWNIFGIFAFATRVGGAKFVELTVDTNTGDVHVTNYVGALGLGKVIFPRGAQSQAEGAFVGMGQGEALYEELLNDPSVGLNLSGSHLNPSILNYKVPTIMECPDKITPVWIEYNDPMGPFGATGIGEPCLIGSSAAIVNALSNALGGYRFTRLPVRREDIIAAVNWMKSTGKL